MLSRNINKVFLIAKRLFPLCRSITGSGTRETLRIIKSELKDLKIHKVSSGTNFFDWKVPKEWIIRDAFILDKNNKKIIDFKKNNLHLVNYSQPINKRLKKNELLKKIYSLKSKKDAIPYVTSYYKKNWGFCTTNNFKDLLEKNYHKNDKFYVKIDSEFKSKGKLNYGELFLKGESKKEILISTYICHPSMANNELSGPMLSLLLAKYFKKRKNKYSIRFLFVPETIGSIIYLKKNLKNLKENVIASYNLTCVGDEKNYSYIPTKKGDTFSDKAILKAFKDLKLKFKKYSFLDRGSDERQYNSPGIDIPMVCFCRSKFESYYEYHTHLDDLNFISKKGLLGSFKVIKKTIDIINKSYQPISTLMCEPFLTKYNLYETLSINNKKFSKDIMNFLQYCDGQNTLDDIAEKIKLNISKVNKMNTILLKAKLIKEVN